MMNNDKTQNLKQSVRTYYENISLSDDQLQRLQQTVSSGTADNASDDTRGFARPFTWIAALSLILLLFTGLLNLSQPPDVIADAYADISKDRDLHNGLQPSMEQWLQENRIFNAPEQYPVEMSKFCHLDQYLTTHLRLAGSKQGKMHLFIHHGSRPISWINRSGDMDDMRWRLLKVRDDLTVIVLYTQDMRETAVQNILQGMLPELSAQAEHSITSV
jgi:hypothetical protein